MNNQQTLAALAALSQLISAAQAPAPAPAPAQQEDDLDGDTAVSTGHRSVLRFRRTLTVFTNHVDKKTGEPRKVDGSKYSVKIGDHISVPRKQQLIPASALVKKTSDSGTVYWTTSTIWEVEIAFTSSGRAWMVSAKNTGEVYSPREDDLSAEVADDLDATEPKAKPEASEPETVPAFEEAL